MTVKFSKDYQPVKNGRPKGAISRTTCIRKALENIALDDSEESLDEFCKFIKKTEPVEFFKAWLKLAPQKIESDNKHTIELSETDKAIFQRHFLDKAK